MTRLQKIFSAAFFLTLFSMSGHANAKCNVAANMEGSISGWPKRIQNSENLALAAAFTNNTCTITKGAHRGGSVPPYAPDDLHVTVRIDAAPTKTCHVFRKASNAPAGTKFPTTCF
ncbi:hypothetical protein [Agrobacterium vitis]|uniref:Uncharacterized protein n=1 Tax=Agrobacterium vitis TaxID=373 RepID=A0A7K1RE49_AGRVI|nr:hypothetical protein [Agrobacterium vitis]MVA56284.1 hypothetical protein [Agrobacterium vitis]